MPGPFIESYPTIFSHKKLRLLVDATGMSEDEAVGKLVRLWGWASAHQEDGVLENVPHELLAEAFNVNVTQWPEYRDALISAKLLDTEPLRIHDYWSGIGSWLKKKYRHQPETWQRVRELYTREQTEILLDTPTGPPESLLVLSGKFGDEIVSFQFIWDKYVEHRKQSKHPLTDNAKDAALKKLMHMPDPFGSLKQSLENGWRGIFEVKPTNSGRGGTRGTSRAGGETGVDELRETLGSTRRIGGGAGQ